VLATVLEPFRVALAVDLLREKQGGREKKGERGREADERHERLRVGS
jgi:hypothetical protein